MIQGVKRKKSGRVSTRGKSRTVARPNQGPNKTKSFGAGLLMPADTDGSYSPEASEAESTNTGVKLQKVLAEMGLGSRREIERWIQDGRVKVNHRLAALGQRVTSKDQIQVDEQPLVREPSVSRRVLVYNKPEGEVCTRRDPQGRPTVFDRLPKLKGERWVAVGRLDINTSGLLLFTTDGELAHRLMHPSTQTVDREYAVRVAGEITDEMIARLKKGVMLDEGRARFTDIQYFDGDGYNKWYHVVIMEGRNREVRRLWESQGIKVSRLKRVRYGCVFLPKNVAVGTWQEMRQKEVDQVAALVGLPSVPIVPLTGQEKKNYERQAQRQKVRQKARKGINNVKSDVIDSADNKKGRKLQYVSKGKRSNAHSEFKWESTKPPARKPTHGSINKSKRQKEK